MLSSTHKMSTKVNLEQIMHRWNDHAEVEVCIRNITFGKTFGTKNRSVLITAVVTSAGLYGPPPIYGGASGFRLCANH